MYDFARDSKKIKALNCSQRDFGFLEPA